jgi:hypothetical protein
MKYVLYLPVCVLAGIAVGQAAYVYFPGPVEGTAVVLAGGSIAWAMVTALFLTRD